MSSAASPLPDLDHQGESQWSIVSRMFRKRTTAVFGLRGALSLFGLAIFAPVLSAGLPFVWREPGGDLEMPWLRRLFDQNYWTNGVDRFFNLVMVLIALYVAARIVLRIFFRDGARRAEHGRRLRRVAVTSGFLLAVAQMLGVTDTRIDVTFTRHVLPSMWLTDRIDQLLGLGIAMALFAGLALLLLLGLRWFFRVTERMEEPAMTLTRLLAIAALAYGLALVVPIWALAVIAVVVLQVLLQRAERWQEMAASLGRLVIGLGAVLAVLQILGLGQLNTSEPYTDYRAKDKVYTAAAGHLAAHRRLKAEGEDAEAALAWAAAVRADHAIAEARKADAAYDGTGYGHTAWFALIPYGHREQLGTQDDQFKGPLSFDGGERHLLGTDKVGRDVFARLAYGTRISMTVGLLAVAIYISIGIVMGGLAGYAGGKVDLAIMRLIEIVICVPGLFLILTIIALFGSRSIFMIMIAIGIVGWTGIARLVRGEFIRERGRDYVAAAKSLGLSGGRILFRHILPNAIAPVIVSATFGVAGAIITESTLSFLGLGDVSVPSWGQLLDEGRQNGEWHLILCPGVAIFLTVTLLNLVGDGLRDALDPKLRN